MWRTCLVGAAAWPRKGVYALGLIARFALVSKSQQVNRRVNCNAAVKCHVARFSKVYNQLTQFGRSRKWTAYFWISL